MSVSQDAAYVIFGFGGKTYTVAPWTDAASLFVPSRPSGPLNVMAALIGLPPAKWAVASTMSDPTQTLDNGLLAAKTAAAALALMPYEQAATLSGARILAYQATAEKCGYLPSSDGLHGDLVNVRQGRYPLWSPLHLFVNTDVTGQPIDHTGNPNPALDAIVAFFSSVSPVPAGPIATDGSAQVSDAGARLDATVDTGALGDVDAAAGDAGPGIPPFDESAYLSLVAQAGLIPWCAMEVTRSEDLGPEMSYQPPAPCGCAFEAQLGATLSTCPPCLVDSDCNGARPRCRLNYCEVQ
jgi:hypothetical protein